MLIFDNKNRITLNELNEKLIKKNIEYFENNEFSLDNIINKKIEDWIKTKIEFSDFELNDFLKQLLNKEMIIEHYISFNELIPKTILQCNKKYYL